MLCNICSTASLGSGTGSCRKIIFYRPNQYELVSWVLVKQKYLGGHRHDLHMCQISDIFKTVNFAEGLRTKKLKLFQIWSYYIPFESFFMLIKNLIRTKVLKSMVRKLLVVVSLVFRHRTLKKKKKKRKEKKRKEINP